MIPEAGQVLAGKYRIERVLGEGGMGLVVSAWHTVLHQHVALKFLNDDAVKDAMKVERFLREARAAASLQSEHVARVIDVGTLDDGVPFLVMELLEGQDLCDIIAAHPKGLPVALAVDYVLQTLDALAEAHANGIIHRDVKPSNLFVASRADGRTIIKVLDFGISKATATFGSDGKEVAALTATTAIVGTPFYMSPEQFRSAKKVDFRTDIWSVGVILYEILTATVPFEGETVGEIFSAVLETKTPSLRSIRSDVPPELEEIVMRCMKKNRDERFANVAELAEALSRFGSGRAAKSVERAKLVSQRRSGNSEVVAAAAAATSPQAKQAKLALTDSSPNIVIATQKLKPAQIPPAAMTVAADGFSPTVRVAAAKDIPSSSSSSSLAQGAAPATTIAAEPLRTVDAWGMQNPTAGPAPSRRRSGVALPAAIAGAVVVVAVGAIAVATRSPAPTTPPPPMTTTTMNPSVEDPPTIVTAAPMLANDPTAVVDTDTTTTPSATTSVSPLGKAPSAFVPVKPRPSTAPSASTKPPNIFDRH